MNKFFRVPFALSGDRVAIPDSADPDGEVSYIEGYPVDYQRPKTDPLSKDVERDKQNQLFYDITKAVSELQSQGIPDFITSGLNGGSPFSYSKNSVVRYSGKTYISKVDANTALPTDDTKWRDESFDAVTPIANGGTGAPTAAGALTNLGLIDMNNSLVVTSATTLDASALFRDVVIGDGVTPADYIVSLPASAPVGSLIQIRISTAATKLYSISGNDVTINGSAARAMWRGEVALLVRQDSMWSKIGGVSIPMVGGMQRTADQTGVAALTYTQVNFTDTFGDPTGLYLPFSSGTGNFLCRRAGTYQLNANVSIAGTGIGGAAAEIAIGRNAVAPSIAPAAWINQIIGVGAARFMASVGATYTLAAGDGIGAIGYIGSGGSGMKFEANSTIRPSLTWSEIPTW